jgi:hypothetical protein
MKTKPAIFGLRAEIENQHNFFKEMLTYASHVREFSKKDWVIYLVWVGLMFGLFLSVSGFIWFGYTHGVHYPAYVWNIPLGIGVFVLAISFDTIGHQTTYKEELLKGERLVHHVTIFSGIASILLLCLAYQNREFFMIPAFVLIGLSIFYSMIDEALHWRRYLQMYSDRVEMWAHYGIFVGHNIMVFAWIYWFLQGYPGVNDTLFYLTLFGLK